MVMVNPFPPQADPRLIWGRVAHTVVKLQIELHAPVVLQGPSALALHQNCVQLLRAGETVQVLAATVCVLTVVVQPLSLQTCTS